MHICIDENSRYDEAMLNDIIKKKNHYWKKTKHGKKQFID
jgi:hypothetical protein